MTQFKVGDRVRPVRAYNPRWVNGYSLLTEDRGVVIRAYANYYVVDWKDDFSNELGSAVHKQNQLELIQNGLDVVFDWLEANP